MCRTRAPETVFRNVGGTSGSLLLVDELPSLPLVPYLLHLPACMDKDERKSSFPTPAHLHVVSP